MKYDPAIHHRRSIRLRDYDYASAGAYFVTVCTHERQQILEPVSHVVHAAWLGLQDRFPDVAVDEFVIMPNHVHGILVLGRTVVEGAASRAPTSLADVVCAFKSVSAIAANKFLGRHSQPFWQRNYYERIIRNEDELNRIRQYVRDNPLRWADDPNNPNNVRVPSRRGAGSLRPCR
ncbi:MAG: transposase [Dehalococcoidia bacterium]|nr:transposase [Dehalococcoidia bacterium]